VEYGHGKEGLTCYFAWWMGSTQCVRQKSQARKADTSTPGEALSSVTGSSAGVPPIFITVTGDLLQAAGQPVSGALQVRTRNQLRLPLPPFG